MKNKIILFVTVIVTFLVTFIISINFNDKVVVYHQHIKNKNHKECPANSSVFCTHLPIVTIDTSNESIPGEQRDGTTITSKINIYNSKDSVNYLTDKEELSSDANIRYRGNSSMSFDKKGLLLKFINNNNEEKKVSVLGMPKHDEWILNGPFLDKTLIRNYMWYNISHEIMGLAPNVRFCEVFINNEYQGIYLMVESPTRGDESRIPISKHNPKYNYTSYIVRIDRGTTDQYGIINSFSSYAYMRENPMDVIYPGKDKMTKELNKYIEKDISKFEKAITSFDYDSKKYGYESYIDIDSFIDYFIINEFTQNKDAIKLSTYLYKDAKGKFGLYVWDFNNAVNNYQEADFPYDFDYIFINRTWYRMLFRDEKFTKRLINRYKYLRTTYLSDDYINNYIDETIKYLGSAIDRNFEVWGYIFNENINNMLSPSTRDPHSYEEAVKQYRERLIARGKWMDNTIDSLKQFSHESKVKKYNH